MKAEIAHDVELDASALHCPLPILKAKKALAHMAPGQVLRVKTTDAGAPLDFAAFARQTGHTLLAQEAQPDAACLHWLRRRSDAPPCS